MKFIATKTHGLIVAGFCSVLLVGCTTNPYTGERETGKSAIYGLGGAAAGAVVGAFQVGTAYPNQVTAVFDGVQWR